MASIVRFTSSRIVVKSTWKCTAFIDPQTVLVRYNYSDFKAGYYSAIFDLKSIGAGAEILSATLSYDIAVSPYVPGYASVTIPDYDNAPATSANIVDYLNTLGRNYDSIAIRFQFRANLSSPGTQKIDYTNASFDSIVLTLLIEGGGDPPAPISGIITGAVEYEMPPVLYDRNFHIIGSLTNASSISYRRVRNDLHTASFELPKEDPMAEKCVTHAIVAIYDNGKFNGLYRIVDQEMTELTSPTETLRYNLEHVIAFLRDDVYDGVVSVSGTVGGIIDSILSQQTTRRWRLGTCEFSAYYDYEFKNESLLSALFRCTEKLTANYHWEYDLTQYPWTVSLVRQNTTPQCAVRYSENLITLRQQRNGQELYTKLFCRGSDNLGIETVNPTHLPYILAPDEVRERNGTISGNYVDLSVTDPERLYNLGLKALNDHMEPRYEYEVSVLDIYRETRRNEHLFDEGKVTKIEYEPMKISAYAMITAVEKPDVLGDPMAVNVEIETMNFSDIEKPIDPSQEKYGLYDQTYINDIDWAGNSYPRVGFTGAGKYSLAHASGSSGENGYLLVYIAASTGNSVQYTAHVATADRVRVPPDATQLRVMARYTEGSISIQFGLLPPDAPNSRSVERGGQLTSAISVSGSWAEYILTLDSSVVGSSDYKVVINGIGTSGAGQPRRNLEIRKVYFQ